MRRTSAEAVAAPLLVPQSHDIGAADHAEFLGMRFCSWTQANVVAAIAACAAAGGGAPYRYVVTPNSYHIVAAHDEPARLLPIYRAAWLSLCDSRIVQALARLVRLELPLVTGSDLVATLLAALNANDRPGPPRRILVVGPPQSAAAALRARYPRVAFEVMPAPAGLAHSAEARLAVARACMNRQWDIALLCVGCPAQEMIASTLAELGCRSGVALCVGAAIDFLTGTSKRAPRLFQRLSLEWAYRLAREPRRLWRRYLVESPRIVWIFIANRSQRGR
ncbi:MAG TPA: WecB/TagA/CpsF family glycosyltransferase [Xanthobacteraceae bacterium]|nr:WecB/TagA/CpsF family glycosyltransferase [Xanthobacteraceae bacterium]